MTSIVSCPAGLPVATSHPANGSSGRTFVLFWVDGWWNGSRPRDTPARPRGDDGRGASAPSRSRARAAPEASLLGAPRPRRHDASRGAGTAVGQGGWHFGDRRHLGGIGPICPRTRRGSDSGAAVAAGESTQAGLKGGCVSWTRNA